MNVLALVNDLLFESRIRAVSEACGAQVRVARDAGAALAALADVDLLLADMEWNGADVAPLFAELRRLRPTARVVAFFSHVRTDQKLAARSAGADLILTRSQFAERLPELLTGG